MAVNYRRANELMLLIAASPSTPAHVLEQLSIEDDPQLLEHIAENPNTPSVTLAYLAGHINSKVRIAVTHNPIAPSDIIGALANDENVDVRYALACNPLIPIALIQEICDDDNPYVAARAQQTFDRMVRELGSASAHRHYRIFATGDSTSKRLEFQMNQTCNTSYCKYVVLQFFALYIVACHRLDACQCPGRRVSLTISFSRK